MRTVLLVIILCKSISLKAVVPTDSLVKGNTQFAFELFAQLDKTKNLFFSPYSISSALAMTYAGARSETANQMSAVMHFEGESNRFHSNFSNLSKEINSRNGSDVEISIANRLFGDKRKKFITEFQNVTSNLYSAPIEQVDFVKQLEKSRVRINNWVEEKTKDKIKELIKPQVLPDSTKLVLVNAIYFYGDWASQFEKDNTQKGKFFTTVSNEDECDLMYQQSSFMYMENDDFKAIQMPYKGNQLSMEIYLPNKTDGLEEFTKTLSAANYRLWSESFEYSEVKLTLPKFKMTSDFSLGEMLQDMGMKLAFSNDADFSGMTGKPELKISKVIHKAFVDVSEKGTEAAAATAVIMTMVDSVAPEPAVPKVFTADHPFFFIIRDNGTGSILFMGQLIDPVE
ncbi:MAG: serpin family protein [Flavobacteriales bacterium]